MRIGCYRCKEWFRIQEAVQESRIQFNFNGDRNENIIVTLHVVDERHDRFVRRGADLYMKMRIFFLEAITKFERTVYTVNGIDRRPLLIKKRSGYAVQDKEKMIVKGHGLPYTDAETREKRKGDLFILFQVEYPTPEWVQNNLELLDRCLPPSPPVVQDLTGVETHPLVSLAYYKTTIIELHIFNYSRYQQMMKKMLSSEVSFPQLLQRMNLMR